MEEQFVSMLCELDYGMWVYARKEKSIKCTALLSSVELMISGGILPSVKEKESDENAQVVDEGSKMADQFVTPEQESPIIEEPPSTMGCLCHFFSLF